jgi:hypothetical protein
VAQAPRASDAWNADWHGRAFATAIANGMLPGVGSRDDGSASQAGTTAAARGIVHHVSADLFSVKSEPRE